MLTQMINEEWEVALAAFDAAQPQRERPGPTISSATPGR
jgi:hypothetical protein